MLSIYGDGAMTGDLVSAFSKLTSPLRDEVLKTMSGCC